MRWCYNDGGRAGDGDYAMLYARINELAKRERLSKRRKTRSSARNGVHRDTFHIVLVEQGFDYGRPMIFNTDQGSRFTGTAFTGDLLDPSTLRAIILWWAS